MRHKPGGKRRVAARAIALLSALLVLAAVPAARAHTRDEVRAAWRAVSAWRDAAPYASLPRLTAPYEAGELQASARQDALATLNFLRWLAGLDPVTESAIYDYQCQHGAALCAALDYVDHNAPMPADMDRNFYDSAHLGTSAGNIAKFNWMRNSILREAVTFFVRDDGEMNLPLLGHRRWALNPLMAATGFGLANSESGMSYAVMYAQDMGSADAAWDRVAWPPPGMFPAELMHRELAWSVTLNPEVYDLAASAPKITLTEDSLDLRFEFDIPSGRGDGFCTLSADPYGAGPCLIFRPDFKGSAFTDYQQNQTWRVQIEGLVSRTGQAGAGGFTTRMISLRPQAAVNIEISRLSLQMKPGETARLSADVIPAYADDLSVAWTSSDPAVARVDEGGLVTAAAPGECEIACVDSAGHRDVCAVRVK